MLKEKVVKSVNDYLQLELFGEGFTESSLTIAYPIPQTLFNRIKSPITSKCLVRC